MSLLTEAQSLGDMSEEDEDEFRENTIYKGSQMHKLQNIFTLRLLWF